MTVGTKIVRSSSALATEAGEALVIMSLEENTLYGLEDVAKRTWELLETEQRFGDLVSHLVQEYEIDQASCEKDLIPFLRNLERVSLITIRP